MNARPLARLLCPTVEIDRLAGAETFLGSVGDLEAVADIGDIGDRNQPADDPPTEQVQHHFNFRAFRGQRFRYRSSVAGPDDVGLRTEDGVSGTAENFVDHFSFTRSDRIGCRSAAAQPQFRTERGAAGFRRVEVNLNSAVTWRTISVAGI